MAQSFENMPHLFESYYHTSPANPQVLLVWTRWPPGLLGKIPHCYVLNMGHTSSMARPGKTTAHGLLFMLGPVYKP